MASRFRDDVKGMQAAVLADLGDRVRYTPAGGGAPVDCYAMPEVHDAEAPLDFMQARTRQLVRSFALRAADVGKRPTKGAKIALLDDEGAVTGTYTVLEDALSSDRFQYVWTCPVGDLAPPSASLDFGNPSNSMYTGPV